VPLLVAGGGGGSCVNFNGHGWNGLTNTSGRDGSADGSLGGAGVGGGSGGTNGTGGGIGAYGGAGWWRLPDFGWRTRRRW